MRKARGSGVVLPEFRKWNLVVLHDVNVTRWRCWVCGCDTAAPVTDGVVVKPDRCMSCKAVMSGETKR